LQVLLLSLQTNGSGLGDEANLAFEVDYLPFPVGVVGFDVGDAVKFQPVTFVYGNVVSPKTMGCAVGAEGDVDVYGFCSCGLVALNAQGRPLT
jgi:hypothetical protein